MNDKEIKIRALAEFTREAPRKFEAGSREHNPKGDKGLWRMSEAQLVSAQKEEVIDMWHYTVALEHKIKEQDALIIQLQRTIANNKQEQ
tara:strand:+ start:352 stop:618 length:267 start_codon:yes stop_codon:yes gene_type:complete